MTIRNTLNRIWETITLQPHRYDTSKEVRRATEAMIEDSQRLQSYLRPYVESEDALVALMTDLFNTRAMRNKRRGRDNARTK